MAKAVVDPEELRRFAQALRRFTQGVTQQMTAMQGMMNQLGETWRDQEHAKFATEFEAIMRSMGRFNEVADAQVPLLMKKAEKIEDYFNSR
ncbi:MAG TPA: WXG100 family type VII secretion target [Phycisphaerales bacterium]|nr:WXG100 family type VII secretion target [Phycisphaerales bacterium]HZW05636.1 WXG100 family type VII secretion target [Phycisphaerales bacterium]